MAAGKPMKLELHAEFPYEEEAEHAGMGTTRLVGYAVKGTPFRLTLKLVSKAKVSMSHAHVQLHLLMEETYAPVDIGERPIKWESVASGSILTCDTRLLVLSTQLAKSCVVIKAVVTLEGQKTLEAMSCPIKVVSKPEQIRRKRKEANQNPELEGSKKRARSEDVLVELRSLYDQSQMLLQAAREKSLQQEKEQFEGVSTFGASQASSSHDMSVSDEETTATDWMTDDGEPFSCTDAMSEGTEENVLKHPFDAPPPAKRACLATTFENILHSFDQALMHADSLPQDFEAVPFQKLKAAFNLLDLPHAIETDQYH